MTQASYNNKAHIVDLLCEVFDSNISVNFLVKQDKHRKKRIRRLMEYAFDMCYHNGNVFLSEDENACALILFPHLKKTSLESIWLNLRLLFGAISVERVFKVLNRDRKIKSSYPEKVFCHLWMIGVKPAAQNRGVGKKLLNEVVNWSEQQGLPVYLETSMMENLAFYNKMNFEVYKEINIPHPFYFIRRAI